MLSHALGQGASSSVKAFFMGLVLESHVTSVLFGRFAEAHAFRHVEEKWNLLLSGKLT